ncbi:MAG: hydantoinase/oxoprolinase N-terminal domain-containing protein [Desulfatibacillaceae bacterium]
MEECVVGIDTGGTFTDGVLLEYRTRRILASSKTLTTREDLALGAVRVLRQLDIRDPGKVRLVGISSTLATNSVAEGKTRKAGLLLIGYDPDLVASYGLETRFSTDIYGFFAGGHTSQGREKEPLDPEAIRRWVAEHRKEVDALAVSSYFSPLNQEHEERAHAVIREECDLPVVLGHQLSTRLDSIKRATTASLNASLVAVMQEFIASVQEALAERNIHAPLMIVKGDGSLMPYEEARHKPVETVLSGPAASAIGGHFLSGHGNALVVDVGGTTTDMTLIENHRTRVSGQGARVGEIQTAVRAAHIRTACVGCDSRIRVAQGKDVEVGPDRVVPLSRLASQHGHVEEEILALAKRKPAFLSHEDFRYWFLYRQVDPEEYGDPKLKRLLRLLLDGPMSVAGILKRLDAHHAVQLGADALLQNGTIEEGGVTPTDLLHASGQMDKWSVEAATQAIKSLCAMHGKDKKAFIRDTMDLIVGNMVEEAIVFLARQGQEETLPDNVDGKWGNWLLGETLARNNPYLAVAISSRFPIIGIGAPAEIFVKRVAEAMRSQFVLPRHSEVANAVGAVAGSVVVDSEAIVYVRETSGSRKYVVKLEGRSKTYSDYEQAVAFARDTVSETALEMARAAGASYPQVHVEVVREGPMERIQARAMGNPSLARSMAN